MARRFSAQRPRPTTLAEAWRVTHRPRVLIADDDAGLRAALGAELGRAGVEVLEARSGAELEELLLPGPWRRGRAQVAPDLIVIGDLAPAGLGGLEALRRLRVVDQSTPVVLVTAADTPAATREAGRLGVTALLHKPIDAAELEALIACLVEVE